MMIQDFTVHLPLETYISRNSEVKTIGDVYIELDGYFFPEKNWYDFGENLLSWWTEEFTKLLNGEEAKVKCGFMDGPFRFDIEIQNNKTWKIQCIKEYSSSEECEYKAEINPIQSSKNLLNAVNAMLVFLNEKEKKISYDFISIRKQQLVKAINKLASTK